MTNEQEPTKEDKKEVITVGKARELYKEQLDELKEHWIKNYYGGDILEAVDPIGFAVGFQDFISESLSDMGYEVEEWKV